MVDEIKIFSNDDFGEIRTVTIDGEPWFVGKDVCNVFGDKNHNRSIGRIADEDKMLVPISDSMGRNQEIYVVNESGLYSLLFTMQPQKANKNGVSNAYPIETQSRIEKLHKFKHWVTSEVIPSIRKHGAYMTNEIVERTLADPDYLIQLATALKEERQARKAAENTIQEQKPLVDFANQVSDTTDLIDMKTMAKLLKDKNIKLGRNKLFDFLREQKILMNDNQPYQQYVDAGYFKVNEYTYTNSFGQSKTNRQTLVTGKGQVYISKKVKECFV